MCNKVECLWNKNGCTCVNSSIQNILINQKYKCILGKIIEVKAEAIKIG